MRAFISGFLILSALLSTHSASASPQAEKEWTFLLFLNGHNNLDQFGNLNLNQMEKVGSSDRVNLVVQWASAKSNRATKRLLVRRDSNENVVTSPVLQEMGRVDMGDPGELKKFILWGMDNYPAKHYFVAVWDHGSGWHNFDPEQPVTKGISWDDYSGNSISTEELGRVMQDVKSATGRKIDIYGSDACLMQMAEIAGEMAGTIDYFVGSQELEPGAGWPYDQFLGPLVSNPSMSPRELSKILVDKYAASYSSGVTLSSLDMSKFDAFARSMARLSTSISSLSSSLRTKVKDAALASMAFDYSDYGDVGDFLQQLNAKNVVFSDASVVRDVKNALGALVVESKTSRDYAKATGLSVWLPKDAGTLRSHEDEYRTLDFNRSTNWSRAISDYLN